VRNAVKAKPELTVGEAVLSESVARARRSKNDAVCLGGHKDGGQRNSRGIKAEVEQPMGGSQEAIKECVLRGNHGTKSGIC
jgi:hypothetical protein